MSLSDSGKDPVPMSEEQIRKTTVGELKPFNRQITLVEYNPEWPMQYENEAG